MEYIMENIGWLESCDWLEPQDQLKQYCDDDYFLFDCPGQIELYSHLPIMRDLVDTIQNLDVFDL
eukprot:363359-Amphidinium_carterae.1